MCRPRVLLADDHTLLLAAFERLLEPDFDVVDTVTDGRTLLDAARKHKPDVIVLDIVMPKLNGLDAAEQLKRIVPDAKLIFLTVNEDPDIAAEALRIGALGYLLKNCAASELFQAIRETLLGRTYVSPSVRLNFAAASPDSSPQRRVRQLTSRQREVLQLLAEGYPMKKIAAILQVSPRTVAFHKYRMMGQLGLGTSAELVQFAVKQGLVSA